MRTERATALALSGAATGLLWVGWRSFWFQTDDAFIAYRYASNLLHGWGLVWNPPPFAPVEGYTSFLWVMLLAGVWAGFGIEPPQAANWLSLACGAATIAVLVAMLRRMPLPRALARRRMFLSALVVFATLTNRTFATWLSSGLETALFNLCWIGWACAALSPGVLRERTWLISVTAALAALTRPDGLLAVAATAALLVVEQRVPPQRRALAALPLLAVGAHAVWRRLTYGAWLPNTYYAKVLGAWPQSGLRYAASFVVEYGVWVWLGVAAVWLVARWRTPREAAPPAWATRAVVTATLAHFAYYTFIVGGDHFEFRVYSHLVPLLLASCLWMTSRISERVAVSAAVLALFCAASYPIAYTHWAQTRHLETRRETHGLQHPIAAAFPALLRAPVVAWDRWQAWLIERHVGMRHQEHKVFAQRKLRLLPSRELGAKIRWRDRPVIAANAVGVVGWVLPEVAVIDTFGLNDRVIAHARPARESASGHRKMAHDRAPPAGYVQCFRPNVTTSRGVATLEPRATPLTDADIRRCESRAWPPDPE